MGFSEQLKIARNTMGYIQQQVADALNLTANIYYGYETDRRQPNVAKLKQLVRILNAAGSFLLETGPIRDTCQAGQETYREFATSCRKFSERSEKTVDDSMTLLLDLQEKSGEQSKNESIMNVGAYFNRYRSGIPLYQYQPAYSRRDRLPHDSRNRYPSMIKAYLLFFGKSRVLIYIFLSAAGLKGRFGIVAEFGSEF